MDANIDKNNDYLPFYGITLSFVLIIISLLATKNLDISIIMLFVGVTILFLIIMSIRLIREEINKIQVIGNSFLIISLLWLILPMMYIYDSFSPFYSAEYYCLFLIFLFVISLICISFFLSNLRNLILNKYTYTNIACGIAVICLVATSVKKQEDDKIYFYKNNGKLANIVYLMLTNDIDRDYIVRNNIPERKVQLEINLVGEQTKGESFGVLDIDLFLEITPLNSNVYEKVRDKEVFTKITSAKILKSGEIIKLLNREIAGQLGVSEKEISINLKKMV